MNYTLKSLLASLLTSVGLVGVCAPPSFADAPGTNIPWTTDYEADPLAGDPVNQGDDWIRRLKTDLRTKLQVEHQIGNFYSGSAQDNALHRVGSARCFFSDAAPTKLGGPEMQSGTVIKDIDKATGAAASGNTHLLTTAETNGSDDEVGSGVARKVGYGRCWIDVDGPDNVAGNYDDYSLYVYNGTGWSVPWFPNKPNSGNNLLPDGGFEGNPVSLSLATCVNPTTDDPWVPAATTNTPIGWQCIDAASDNQIQNEVITDNVMGQGYGIQVKSNGDTLRGIWAQVELKDLTQYNIAVQVIGDAADDVCVLAVDSPPGSSDELTLSHTGTAQGYLQGTFKTTSDPTTEVFLKASADGDICTFDNIRLVEAGAIDTTTGSGSNVASSGSFYWYKEATSQGTVAVDGTTGGTDIITSPTFKVNAPNCTYIVKGTTNIKNESAVGHWGTEADEYYDFGALAANVRILTNGATSAVTARPLCPNGILTNIIPSDTAKISTNVSQTELYCSMIGTSGSYYYTLDTLNSIAGATRIYNTGYRWGIDTKHVEHVIVNPPPGTTYAFKLNAAMSYDPPGSATMSDAFRWCGGDCHAGADLGDVSGFPPNRLSVQAICPGD